jgi:hypothetical protein
MSASLHAAWSQHAENMGCAVEHFVQLRAHADRIVDVSAPFRVLANPFQPQPVAPMKPDFDIAEQAQSSRFRQSGEQHWNAGAAAAQHAEPQFSERRHGEFTSVGTREPR